MQIHHEHIKTASYKGERNVKAWLRNSAPILETLVTFRLTTFRLAVLLLLGALTLAAALLVVIAIATPDGALRLFLFLWVAAVAWTAYWALFRFAYEVAIDAAGTFRWCSITGCHEAPVSAIEGIATPWGMFGAGMRRIRISGANSPLLIASAPGFEHVIAAVVNARPDLNVANDWYDGLAARFGRRSMRWVRI